MKPETLFESLQQLDETILEESELPIRRSWKRWAAAAACICVVAIGAFTALRMGETAKWNVMMDTFEPNDLIRETNPVSPSSHIAGEADAFEAHMGTETPPETDAPPDRLPQHVPLFWNDADPVAADAAPVAGVIIVSEPLTKAQIEMTAPDEVPEWLDFSEGYASYFLKDGAGGLQSLILSVKDGLRGVDATVQIYDLSAPTYAGSCPVAPRSEDVVGTSYGLEYTAYQYVYLHGEGDPERYPPREWTSLRVEFTRGGAAYCLSAEIPSEDAEAAKLTIADILYYYACSEAVPDLSSFQYGEYLLRDETLTLEEAKADPDFGTFLPSAPAGFGESDFRRFQFEEIQNYLSADWRGGYGYLEWYIAYADEDDLARLTSPEERSNYDLSLYPIPRGESVPREKWEIVDRPVFRSEELTPDMVKARAYTVSDAGDADGWRMRFSVLFPGGVLVRIDAKGLSPEWIFEQVSQLG